MSPRPYYVKRALSLGLALAIAGGISFLGEPTNRTIRKETPIALKKKEMTGYGGKDLASMEIYPSGSSQSLCRVVSTTAVRNYFDGSGNYVERTRIDHEACKLPGGNFGIDVIVTSPYKPGKIWKNAFF